MNEKAEWVMLTNTTSSTHTVCWQCVRCGCRVYPDEIINGGHTRWEHDDTQAPYLCGPVYCYQLILGREDGR